MRPVLTIIEHMFCLPIHFALHLPPFSSFWKAFEPDLNYFESGDARQVHSTAAHQRWSLSIRHYRQVALGSYPAKKDQR